MDRIGWLTLPPEALLNPNMKYDRVPIVGNDHPISHHSLARMGATFLGRLNGISSDGTSATFNDKLQEYIAFAQEGYEFLALLIEDWIANRGNAIDYLPPRPEPQWEPHSANVAGFHHNAPYIASRLR